MDLKIFHSYPLLFLNKNMYMVIGVYVDYLVIIGEGETIEDCLTKLQQKLVIKMKQTVYKFIGCEIKWLQNKS